MRLTICDDGIACPAGCDAHFLMNSSDNGTRYAFRPDSSRDAPKVCILNHECTICFGEGDHSCMSAKYRGGGPSKGTFDFTPAFYEAMCPRSDIPDALKRQCRALDQAVKALGYNARVNCFATPDHPNCRTVVAQAAAAQRDDTPKREKCLSLGEAAYNQQQTDAREQRVDGCNYSKLLLGGSAAKKWHRLLPAACRPGTFVDPFGLDCCSADVRFAASVDPECRPFFPRP